MEDRFGEGEKDFSKGRRRFDARRLSKTPQQANRRRRVRARWAWQGESEQQGSGQLGSYEPGS